MEYSIAQVEQLQRREQLAAIESEAQEAWRQVERSHLKTQFAREILRAAEAEHSERKGQYDALAASLEDAMRAATAADDGARRREEALLASRGGAARAPNDVVGGVVDPPSATTASAPPFAAPTAPSAPAAVPTGLPNGFLQPQRGGHAAAPAQAAPPDPHPRAAANRDVDHLSRDFERGIIKEKRSSWIPGFGRSRDAPQQPPKPPPKPPPPPPPPPPPNLMEFPEEDEEASSSASASRGTLSAGGMSRVASGASGGSGGGGAFSPREEIPPDLFAEPPAAPAAAAVPNSPEVRRSAQTQEERQREEAVRRSRREAEEERARARAARERRQNIITRAAEEANGECREKADSASSASSPVAAAAAEAAKENASSPGADSKPADSPPPTAVPPPPPTSAGEGRAGEGPASGDGPASAGTALGLANEEIAERVRPFLPRAHVPRDGLTAHQRTLGPPGGEFCQPRFCHPRCVSASCVAFTNAFSPNSGQSLSEDADATAITRSLKKLVIRNHPDRNSVDRVGARKAATATALTQRATSLLAMLEEHEYVNLVVDVPPSGDRAGGGGPASSVDQRVTLNRVHLGTTPSQLLDAVLEERPELRASRDRLAMAFVDGARARGGASTRASPSAGGEGRQKTLRELGVTSAFRVWVEEKNDGSGGSGAWEPFAEFGGV